MLYITKKLELSVAEDSKDILRNYKIVINFPVHDMNRSVGLRIYRIKQAFLQKNPL